MTQEQGIDRIKQWTSDWNRFAYEGLSVILDREQQEILESVQCNQMTSVASGTARGKDFVTAVASICFLYLTPKWNDKGELIENTKVALTAPTDRQIKNIMISEIARIFNRARKNGLQLPGRLTAYDIRTNNEEWFLTGFKADEHNHEAWTGFHAVNTMFAVTEASGISDETFNAIEGNLQGNSRFLIVFNPNVSTGYAAKSQKSHRFSKFRLSSLTAPNVIEKRNVIPGQVDYDWVVDKVQSWCTPIMQDEAKTEFDDFQFEGQWYRPEDLFRIKVLGQFPKIANDALIPQQWIEAANERWKTGKPKEKESLLIGVDVAGMGRDNSVFCPRRGNYVVKFDTKNSGGRADHMKVAGEVKVLLDANAGSYALIDTIGEGAGVYSRLEELGYAERALSCKYSEAARDIYGNDLTDITGQYKFANMRAYLFWAVRDWIDPANKTGAMIPPSDKFLQQATEIKWKFRSDGKIIIEPKEDIISRLGYSTDEFDSLANTFYPNIQKPMNMSAIQNAFR